MLEPPEEKAKRPPTLKKKSNQTDQHRSHLTICDSCGKRVPMKDLHVHQKATRCVESKLKQEVIQSARQLKREVTEHALQLKKEKVQMDRYEKRLLRESVHERLGWMPRVPSAMDLSSLRHHTHKNPPRQCSTAPPSGHRAVSTDYTKSPSPIIGTLEITGHQGTTSAVTFPESCSPELTASQNPSPDINISEYQAPCPTSVMTSSPSMCSRCSKYFWPHANHKKACRWHRGVSLSR